MLAISAPEDPLLGSLGVAGLEVLHRGGDEVGRELLGDIAHRRVGDDRDLPHALVVIAHEAEVRRHGAEAVPAWKPRRIDDDAGELALRFDERVDGPGEPGEVFLLERTFRTQVQDAACGIEVVLEHVALLLTQFSARGWTTA